MKHLASLIAFTAILAGCVSNPIQSLDGSANPAGGPPSFESASPTAGSSTSQTANALADKSMYKDVDYKNAAKKGPQLIVIPGDIKSANATFSQKISTNNIADFAELELGRANFGVLERNDLGPVLNEFQIAYTMGDPKAARKVLQKGKFKTTKWIVKFDVLKAEHVADAKSGFDGQTLGRLAAIGLGGRSGAVADTVGGSVKSAESSGVWVIGMRFKLLDANTTEQVATGYTEEKMEIGATGTSVLGIGSSVKGGVSLDTMVQRLVQKLVYEIDAKYK